MTAVLFLTAVLGAPCVLGLPCAVNPTLRSLSLVARLSLAWVAGALALTAILTFCSAVGLRWTPWPVALAGAAAVAEAVRTVRREPPARTGSTRSGRSCGWLTLAVLALIAAGTLLGFGLGAATSADLSYFWGVKAVRFALERGVDFDLLKQPFMIHLHPNYPPLWPVLLGWGAMVAHSMPWPVVPSLTWVCLSAAAAVIFSVVKSRLGSDAAAAVTCLWYVVLGATMIASFSGGNADGPVVLFLSVALVVILTEADAEHRPLRWVAAVALAGAVFTKSEGVVTMVLIAAGTAARDLLWGRRAVLRQTLVLVAPALAAAALWAAVRMIHGLPLSDPIRETAFQIRFDHIGLIVRMCARMSTSGAVAVGWLVPLVAFLIAGPRHLKRALPGIVTASGILLFAVAYYLHAAGDPRELIVWTFPRLIQPALSAWILGLGVATFSVSGARESTVSPAREASA